MSASPIKILHGWSEHAWKSLAVKSYRVGWPDAWNACCRVLSEATIRGIATVQIFEDTAPSEEGAVEIADAILAGDWLKVLSTDTHHGKGFSEIYCHAAMRHALPVEPKDPREKIRQMRAESLRLRLNLPPRAWFWWYAWETRMKIHHPEKLRDGTRPLWKEKFVGMPDVVLDRHTPEGKRIGQHEGKAIRSTIWCGDPEGHCRLAAAIEEGGWEAGRAPGRVLALHATERHQYFLDGTAEQRALFG